MKNAAVLPAPGSGADIEALIKEARRRQRNRRAVAVAAAAAVLTAALGVFAGSHGAGGGRGPRARPAPGLQPGTPPARRYAAPSRQASTRPC